MYECVILYGTSGSGKTTYAEKMAKEGYVIVEVDKVLDFKIDYSNKLLVLMVLEDLKKRIEKYDRVCLVGYIPECDLYFKWFKEHICENLKIKVLFAPAYMMMHRRAQPDHPHYSLGREDVIRNNYLKMIQNCGDIKDLEFTDTRNIEYKTMRFENEKGFLDYWRECNKTYTPEEIKEFFKKIPEINPEHAYMDIELHPYYQIGYVHSYYSWVKIQNLIDFTMRSVVDVGCNQGYFCFKAYEARAKSVTGVDWDSRPLAIAKTIRDIKKYNVSFVQSYVEDSTMPPRDITLCMNVLHHFKDKEKGLFNVFSNSGVVLFECNHEEEELIAKYAQGFNKTLKVTMSSHRENLPGKFKRREILLYE